MHILFYCSVASQEMADNDILEILNVAREKNAQLGVTGLLVYQKKTREFFQIIEGEKKTIYNLLDIIKNDYRHTGLDIVYEGETQERYFGKWSMAFENLNPNDQNKLEGFSEFLEKGFSDELIRNDSAYANRLIKTFKNYIESTEI